jgi:hypothetical protein
MSVGVGVAIYTVVKVGGAVAFAWWYNHR